MPLDLAQMRHAALSAKSSRPVKPRKRANTAERGGIGRQRMGLLVGHHLQPVLDAAQKIVSRGQLVARRGVDPAVGGEHGQRGDGAAAAQFAVAAAGDELLGLHEELDLADAAAAELDIVALDRDLAVAAIGMDLPLHLVDVGDGRVVEIFAPDERATDRATSFSPAARSPAQARALISAARSQFWPRLS